MENLLEKNRVTCDTEFVCIYGDNNYQNIIQWEIDNNSVMIESEEAWKQKKKIWFPYI